MGVCFAAFPVQILLEWCKQNMSAADMGKIHGAIRDMKVRFGETHVPRFSTAPDCISITDSSAFAQTKVAQGTKSPKDVYAAILTLIGADRVNDVKAHIVREVCSTPNGPAF